MIKMVTLCLQHSSQVTVSGHPEKRLLNTLNICLKCIEGESILINLVLEGICASSGSACTSGSLEPSHVLLAIGISPEVAHGSLRLSLNKFTTEKDVDKVLEVLPTIAARLRGMSPFWGKKGAKYNQNRMEKVKGYG